MTRDFVNSDGCRSIAPRYSLAFEGDLSRLVHQRAARKPPSDARTATYMILSIGWDQEENSWISSSPVRGPNVAPPGSQKLLTPEL
jgi:hypothetical protein